MSAALYAAGLSAQTLLIQNADVETMTDEGRLASTDVLVVDGRVLNVGNNLSSEGARVIDGTGKRLTPGLFNAFTHIGVVEIDGIEQTWDASAASEDFTASLSVIDAFNPNSTLIPQNRIQGVTRVVVAPQAENSLFAGKVAVVNLSGSFRESIEKESVGVLVNYNEFAAGAAGGSRAAALAAIRRALHDTSDYSANKQLFLDGEGRELSLSLDDLDALAPVIDGAQYLFVNVSRSPDILRVLELGESFKLQLILVGAEEGWMVAEDIARSGATVILDPSSNLPLQYETLGARLENAAMLNDAGVRLMFTGMGWHNTHNAFLVAQCAGIAVANGLPYDAALRALFTTPSEVFGLDNSGQIAVGAKADLVLWSNDPLEVVREAEMVFVDGKEIPMVSRSTRLRDRYFDRLRHEPAPAEE
jgi:imidazolonepropionase-like amidohydrolase